MKTKTTQVKASKQLFTKPRVAVAATAKAKRTSQRDIDRDAFRSFWSTRGGRPSDLRRGGPAA